MPAWIRPRIKTQASRTGDRYIINGQKVWTSTAQQAAKIVLLARTTPIEQCERPIDGLSLFYADLDRSAVEIREIQKMGRHAVEFQSTLFRQSRNPGRLPDRRGRKRLSLPSRQSEPRAHSQRSRGHRDGRGGRWRRRLPTPTNASSLAARSGKTNRSSILSRNAGPNCTPPN